MDDKVRCQSDGMPLGTPGGYGTNSDGSENHEYCRFCYQNGAFTNPSMTVEDMVASSIKFMTENLGYPESQAREISLQVIPRLKRWAKT